MARSRGFGWGVGGSFNGVAGVLAQIPWKMPCTAPNVSCAANVAPLRNVISGSGSMGTALGSLGWSRGPLVGFQPIPEGSDLGLASWKGKISQGTWIPKQDLHRIMIAIFTVCITPMSDLGGKGTHKSIFHMVRLL